MQRYVALDALRGLTIALMILVNTPGSWSHVYAPLLHAQWHGLTPTDLVFPFFLFIVGSAMFFAFKKLNFQLTPAVAVKVVKRGALIFLIGFLLNIYPFTDAIENWRVMGVLQRIGIAYVAAAFIVLCFNQRMVLLCSVLILVCYSLLLLSVGEQAYNVEDNLVRQVDLMLLGASHMYSGMGIAFDPEGVLSTLPSVVSVLIGFEVTRFISHFEDKAESTVRVLQMGVIALIVGWLLSNIIPINKALWTSSYVIYSSGFACLTLALFMFVIDIKAWQKPVEPLLIYGTNPLFIYVLSWLWVATYLLIPVGDTDLYKWLFHGLASVLPEKFASFIFAFSHVVLFWWLSKLLFDRKIFIKI